ncbi:MAG: DUF6445 family protein [Chlamydiales bacterium]|nr:DUF6445 family protein [Chlamydiales bacterium]
MFFDPSRLAINDESDLDIQIINITDQAYPCLVIDNFYRDPEYIRKLALSLSFRKSMDDKPASTAIIYLNHEPILELVYELLAKDYGLSWSDFFTFTAFGFKFALYYGFQERLKYQAKVISHPHSDDALLAGIIYLNQPEQCKGGTAFYKHKATLTEQITYDNMGLPFQGPHKRPPSDPTVVKKVIQMGLLKDFLPLQERGEVELYSDFVNLITQHEEVAGYDQITDSNEAWDLTHLIEMKYNRFIYYPAFVFHSPYFSRDWFGNTRETRRLTQNFFTRWPVKKG